jgi:molybdate transport system substrate-binding protein
MRAFLAVPVAATLLLLAGCAAPAPTPAPTTEAPSPTTAPEPELTGELTIYAAASLKAAFDEIAGDFETANPGVDVLPITYDGSSTLATQIIEGAPADVFASADEANMQKIVDAGLVLNHEAQFRVAADTPIFATNTLVVATPPDNPGAVTTLADLAKPEVSVVLCAPEVPCGRAAGKLLELAGLAVTPVSQEQNVTAVLTKVAAGEADAGLVYATDVQGNDQVDSFVPEHADEVVNRYPIAVLEGAGNAEAADAFLAYVTGVEGQAVLSSFGFGAP